MMPDIDSEVIHAGKQEIDACKKRLGANPKTFRQLIVVEQNWAEAASNYFKLRSALCNQFGSKTLVLDGVEL
ncbi:MAG TPA: hypothetical protein O0Y17_01155 [Methanocorpusculum sp.]|nr:hypothetical protein [Methanocorpusculum sp.]